MGQHDFNDSKWIADLGTALAALAQDASEGILRDASRARQLLNFGSMSSTRSTCGAQPAAQNAFKTLRVKLNRFPTEAMAILLDIRSSPCIAQFQRGWRDSEGYGGRVAWSSTKCVVIDDYEDRDQDRWKRSRMYAEPILNTGRKWQTARL